MEQQIYSIFDEKAEIYSPPWYSPNNATAIRAFTEVVNQGDHVFNKHPNDYTLVNIGSFMDDSAIIDGHEPIALGKAEEYVNKNAPELEKIIQGKGAMHGNSVEKMNKDIRGVK